MATVNKNFRIKNGLVVEGSTATVNGQNVLTETGSDTYILNLIGGETLVKSVSSDFKVTTGGELQIDSISDLARTGDITTAINNLDTDDIEEGSTNKYYVKGTAEADIGAFLSNSSKTNISITYDPANGLDISAENGVADSDTDDLTEGTSNLYFTESRARDAFSAGTGITLSSGEISVTSGTYEPYGTANALINDSGSSVTQVWSSYKTDTELSGKQNTLTASTGITIDGSNNISVTSGTYDAYGSASTAEANANTYTDNAIGALDADDIPEASGLAPINRYFTDERAVTAVSNALGSGLTVSTGQIVVDTSTIATQTYVNDAIDNLVDGAPGLLDTLNEIAAAINDDENYFTTVSTAINAKQDTLTAGLGIEIIGSTISVKGLDTDDVDEGSNLYFTDARARSAVDGTDRSFTSLEINEVAKQVAATTGNISTAAATTALSWAKADYRSGKFTVKVKNGSHTEVSEILVTLDTSDNVAITEYGIVGTNGSLSTISADIDGPPLAGVVRIRVTPANDNSEVMVVGTLLI